MQFILITKHKHMYINSRNTLFFSSLLPFSLVNRYDIIYILRYTEVVIWIEIRSSFIQEHLKWLGGGIVNFISRHLYVKWQGVHFYPKTFWKTRRDDSVRILDICPVHTTRQFRTPTYWWLHFLCSSFWLLFCVWQKKIG